MDARPISQWNGTARSRNEPALLFAPAGTGPAIVNCNAGFLSATDLFVLTEVLHRPDVKLYEGSISEWTADPFRPVEP